MTRPPAKPEPPEPGVSWSQCRNGRAYLDYDTRFRRVALGLETRLHDLVNAAYGLTPEEVRLLWDTAPPRMPIPRPAGV